MVILAAWPLLYVRLQQEYVSCRIVIQRNTINYEQPIVNAFLATSTTPNSLAWAKFMGTLKRRNRANFNYLHTHTALSEETGWQI